MMKSEIRTKTCNRRAKTIPILPNGSKFGINGRNSATEVPMNHHRIPALHVLALLPLPMCALVASAAGIKGATVLNHPCGKDKKTTKDANGTCTSTTRQGCELTGNEYQVSR
jgi:hypothetical protein